MKDASLRAVSDCVATIQRAIAPDRSLSVLVLGDPDASVCRLLAEQGYEVSCCPDGQRSRGGEPEHVRVIATNTAELVESNDDFDVAVAVHGWSRIAATHPPWALAGLLRWLGNHALVTVVTAPRRVLAPDLNELGPYSVRDVLGGFRYLAEAVHVDGDEELEAPLVLASDSFLVLGSEWIPDADVQPLGEGGQPDDSKAVRTFRIPGGRIAKVECASEEYFERTQVVGEWSVLDRMGGGARWSLDLPEVHSLHRGRAVVALVRDDVIGSPNPSVDVAAQLSAVLDVARRYSNAGLFHNDLRPWNLVWRGGTAVLVDFAEVSDVDDDCQGLPQVLALAGTLAALATDEIRWGEHFHEDVLALADRAGLASRWPLDSQRTEPWTRLSRIQLGVDIAEGMTATEIIGNALRATVA